MSVRGDREVLTEATVHHGGLGLYRVNVSVGPTHTVVYRHGPLCNAQTDLIMKHKISLFKRNPFKTLMSQVGQVIVIDKVVKEKKKEDLYLQKLHPNPRSCRPACAPGCTTRPAWRRHWRSRCCCAAGSHAGSYGAWC